MRLTIRPPVSVVSTVSILSMVAFAGLAACGDDDTSPPTQTEDTAVNDVGQTDDAGADTTSADVAEYLCPEPTGARPAARAEHAGIYNPENQSLVIFGGSFGIPVNCSNQVAHTYESDTWVYDVRCGQWREIEAAGPAGRVRHSAVYDPKGHRMLVYGGRSRPGSTGAYTLYNAVESFDLNTETWSTLTTTNAPAGRFNTTMVYDEKAHRVLMFGGNTSSSGAVYSDTAEVWTLDLASNAWSKLAPAAGPDARFWAAGVMDTTRNWLVIYGGSNAAEVFNPNATYYDDLWALDLNANPPVWYQLDPGATTPPGRFWSGMAFDATGNRYVMFGGHDDQNLGNRNDTWAYDVEAQAWGAIRIGDTFNNGPTGVCQFPPDFTLVDADSPERRHAGVFAQGPGLAIATGGKTDCGNVDDIYAFDFATSTWTELLTATIGEACLRKGGGSCTDMCL